MNEHKKTMGQIFHSPTFRKIGVGIGVLLGAIIIFQAGVAVGFTKASFSYRGGDNFYRAFGEDRRGHMMGMIRDEFPGANGSAGRIVSITPPLFVVEDRDAVEKVIRIGEETTIREGRTTISLEELRVNDMVVVIGSPNDNAEIEAKLIRVLPPPPQFLEQQSSGATNTPT